MISYRQNGSGLPVVLLHGFCENQSLWDDLLPQWAQHGRIITVDLPGFGNSAPLAQGFGIEEVAASIHDFLTREISLTKYVVLGHSLGGYVSLALAANFPDYVGAFGLINSTSLADSEEKKAQRLKTAAFIRQHGVAAFSENFVPNLFAPENRQRLADKLALVRQMTHGLDKEVVAGYMLAMRQRPGRMDVFRQNKPVMFVAGLQDPHISHTDIELHLNGMHNKKLGYALPGVAHMSMYEAPDKLNEAFMALISLVKS